MPSSDVESGLEVSRNSRVNVGADGGGYVEWVPKPVAVRTPPHPLPTHARARTHAHTPPSPFQRNSFDFCFNIFSPKSSGQGLIFIATVDKVPRLDY